MATRDPDVPRLPRGRGISLNGPALFRILMIGVVLVAMIMLQRPCADAVSGFVTQFEPPDARRAVKAPDAGAATVDPYGSGYIKIDGEMTEDDVKNAIDQARTGAGAVPGAATGTGTGTVPATTPGTGTAPSTGAAPGAPSR